VEKMDNNTVWIWLTEALSRNCDKISRLLSVFEDAEDIYKCKDFSRFTYLNEKQKAKLTDKDLNTAHKIIERCGIINSGIITYTSPDYPDLLRKINDPPYVLYIKGEKMKWDRLMPISVIGTRKYNDYGLNAAWAITTGLTKAGITVVSGMARGLDSVAAAAALKAGGKTIAVLGCGLDIVYPRENDELMEMIINNGSVISEYPPGTQPLKSNFPMRNRIISGISRGTLVVQAPQKSGTLITARYALDNGRDVFAVPGDINLPENRGTNALIKAGAKLVENSNDILSEYSAEITLLEKPEPLDFKFEYNPESQKAKKKKAAKKPINNEKIITIDNERYSDLDDAGRKIIECLIENNMHIDDLARKLETPVSSISTTLTMLEMQGHIVSMPGKLFRLNI